MVEKEKVKMDKGHIKSSSDIERASSLTKLDPLKNKVNLYKGSS
jgi:hypothetical protein